MEETKTIEVPKDHHYWLLDLKDQAELLLMAMDRRDEKAVGIIADRIRKMISAKKKHQNVAPAPPKKEPTLYAKRCQRCGGITPFYPERPAECIWCEEEPKLPTMRVEVVGSKEKEPCVKTNPRGLRRAVR